MKIFVANLPYHITTEGIRQLFSLFGAVISTKIVTQNGKSKGFGFLEMEDDERAKLAIKELDGSPIADRNIVVRPADDQQEESKKVYKRPRIAFRARMMENDLIKGMPELQGRNTGLGLEQLAERL